MKRVFYFTNHELQIFHWIAEKSTDPIFFSATEEGYRAFSDYLSHTQQVPIRVLVDRIDEEFSIEHLPHTNVYHRKAILQRHLGRLQRANQFAAGMYQETLKDSLKKDKPKKDVFLFAYMKQAEQLLPWLNIINELQVPMEGIWSLPLLSEILFDHAKIHAEHLLLVTQQVETTVRLSYFHDEHLKVSREAQLIEYDPRSNDYDQLSQLLKREVDATESFLRNQKFIARQHLRVVVMMFDAALPKLKEHMISEHEIEYEFLSLETVARREGEKGYHSRTADDFFCYLCSKMPVGSQHYAQQTERLGYVNFKTDGFLKVAMVACFLVVLAYGHYVFYQSQFLSAETDRVLQLTAVRDAHYQRLYAEDETLLSYAEEIAETVGIAKGVQAQDAVSPMVFNRLLSKSLSQEAFDNINILSVSWQRLEPEAQQQLIRQLEDQYEGNEGDQSETEDAFASIEAVAEIKASIPFDNTLYREISLQVDDWIATLLALDRIVKVELINHPVETRSDKAFGDRAGISSSLERLVKYSEFMIKVYVRRDGHVG